jgi:hypothetical protein
MQGSAAVSSSMFVAARVIRHFVDLNICSNISLRMDYFVRATVALKPDFVFVCSSAEVRFGIKRPLGHGPIIMTICPIPRSGGSPGTQIVQGE